jgi:hypothetical protein
MYQDMKSIYEVMSNPNIVPRKLQKAVEDEESSLKDNLTKGDTEN